MILQHPIKETDQSCLNGATVDLASYNIGANKVARANAQIWIIDLANGATGYGEYVVNFHRYGGPTAIDSTDAIIPLKTPGVLNGSSVSFNQTSNTVTARFTGVAGRNIRVICQFQLTTITD